MSQGQINQSRLNQGSYTIRELDSAAEFLALEALQRTAWGTVLTIAPMFKISRLSGGVVLGAFPKGGELPVGLAYGFPALAQGRWWHHSHLLAVNPEWRGSGMALELKLAQRDRVLSQGLTRMTWTFDPLVARNARFNLGKLGAVVRQYHPELYPDPAFPQDRLMVEWDLQRAYRPQPAPVPEGEYLLQADAEGQPAPVQTQCSASRLLVEVPTTEQSGESRLAWRLALREALCPPLQQGYVLTDLARTGEQAYYLLEQDTGP